MMAWIYLTMEQVVAIHRNTLDVSGGGIDGERDLDPIESVIHHMQNDDYYPEFEQKLTHLFFCVCKFHGFLDGNKRLAIALCAQMLLFNGYLFSIKAFIYEAENICYHVAAGKISKELLGEWMKAVLCGEEDDESLKLKIYLAISELKEFEHVG